MNDVDQTEEVGEVGALSEQAKKNVYLVIYGAGYLNYKMQGKDGELGTGLERNARAMVRNIENRKDFNHETDVVVLAEAKTVEQFVNAINDSHSEGKIVEMVVYSHGYTGGLNLGGQTISEIKEELKEQEFYGVLDLGEQTIDDRATEIAEQQLDVNNSLRNINVETMRQIEPSNFADNAQITLYGYNVGGGWNRILNAFVAPSDSFAQHFANYIGERRTVDAFKGGSEFTTDKNGKNIYGGRMIRTADRKSQKTIMITFKPTPSIELPE
jgi:hypothetical protein